MTREFKKGERVSWNTPQGETSGRVVERINTEKRVKGGKNRGTLVKGSDENPRYLVESETSGKQAGHRADALKKRH